MNDTEMASLARDLALALMVRARTRLPSDQQKVLQLQTTLCQAVLSEGNVRFETETGAAVTPPLLDGPAGELT